MKIGIVQPYIFPYIGYFQLINSVNLFVFYDDVNFIKRGWVNRNNIIVNNQTNLFTIPLENGSQNVLIKDVLITKENKWRRKLITKIEMAYKKAKYFDTVFPIIKTILSDDTRNISMLSARSIIDICSYLAISTKFKFSSESYNNQNFNRQDRLIDICKQENANIYTNPNGGKILYSKKDFKKEGIILNFISSNEIVYKQNSKEFIPNLSIIDLLMNLSKEEIKEILEQYNYE